MVASGADPADLGPQLSPPRPPNLPSAALSVPCAASLASSASSPPSGAQLQIARTARRAAEERSRRAEASVEEETKALGDQ
eukprot:gene3805-50113_t